MPFTSSCELSGCIVVKTDRTTGYDASAEQVVFIGIAFAFSDASAEQPALLSDSAEQPVKGFIVDDIQLLTPEQANTLKPMLIKMLYFAALAGQISRKRAREPWSPTENPADAALCRTLGRSPTGPPLPEYSPSP